MRVSHLLAGGKVWNPFASKTFQDCGTTELIEFDLFLFMNLNPSFLLKKKKKHR